MKRIYSRPLTWIFVAGLFLRIGYSVTYGGTELSDDAWYYDKKARTVLKGEGFVNDNLYAYAAPGYSAFLVAVYGLFGPDPRVACAAQSILGALTILLVYRVGASLSSPRTGLLAAALVAFYPRLLQSSAELWSETLYVFLLFLCLAIVCSERTKSQRKWRLLGGAVLGCAALTREIGLYAVGCLFLWAWIEQGGLRKAVRFAAPVLAGLVLVVAPWTVRNYLRLRAFVPISTNGPINLYLGNGPEATGLFHWALPEGVRWNTAEGEEFPGQNEIETARSCLREAVAYMIEHPGRTFLLSLKKVWYLWGIPTYAVDFGRRPVAALKQAVNSLYYLLVLVPVLLGILTRKSVSRSLSLCWLFLLYHTLIHMMTFAVKRHFTPMVPFLCILAAAWLATVAFLSWIPEKAADPSRGSSTYRPEQNRVEVANP